VCNAYFSDLCSRVRPATTSSFPSQRQVALERSRLPLRDFLGFYFVFFRPQTGFLPSLLRTLFAIQDSLIFPPAQMFFFFPTNPISFTFPAPSKELACSQIRAPHFAFHLGNPFNISHFSSLPSPFFLCIRTNHSDRCSYQERKLLRFTSVFFSLPFVFRASNYLDITVFASSAFE